MAVVYVVNGGRCVYHKGTNMRLWKDFIDGVSTEIPDAVIADIDDDLKRKEHGLALEECSELHFVSDEIGLEKICYNLSDEILCWTTKK